MYLSRRTLLKSAAATAAGLVHKSFSFDVKDAAADGSFAGYGSVFGNVDEGGDVVEAGAFKDSLAGRATKGRKMPVLWQHKWAEPIGVYTKLEEDSRGLYVEGQLLVEHVQRAKEAHALAKAGAVTGLSIGYRIPQGGYETDKSGVTHLRKLDLEEISLVTFPMNEDARVEAVKARAIERTLKSGKLPTLPEFEDLLREVGFSNTQAKAVAGGGLSKLLRCEAESDDSKAGAEVLDLLKSFKLPTI